jgi:hypothetical protein
MTFGWLFFSFLEVLHVHRRLLESTIYYLAGSWRAEKHVAATLA